MIAAFVLLHPEAALSALFGTDLSSPFNQLLVNRKVSVVNLICLGLNGGKSALFGHFFARFLDVVDDITLETVFDATHGTAQIPLIVVVWLTNEEVIAALGWALTHISILVPYLLPFELLTTVHLFRCQKLAKIRQGYGNLAAGLWAHNRQLLIFNAGLDPWKNALRVVNVCTDTKRKDLTPIFREEGHLTDFADVLLLFTLLPLFNFFELSEQLLLNLLRRLLLHLGLLFLQPPSLSLSSLYPTPLLLLLSLSPYHCHNFSLLCVHFRLMLIPKLLKIVLAVQNTTPTRAFLIEGRWLTLHGLIIGLECIIAP